MDMISSEGWTAVRLICLGNILGLLSVVMIAGAGLKFNFHISKNYVIISRHNNCRMEAEGVVNLFVNSRVTIIHICTR